MTPTPAQPATQEDVVKVRCHFEQRQRYLDGAQISLGSKWAPLLQEQAAAYEAFTRIVERLRELEEDEGAFTAFIGGKRPGER